MNKLMAQIMKFGVVGVICFLIDFCLYTLCNAAGIPYLISGFIGFIVSMVVNYLLSMKFVFARKDDLSRRREFIIFFVLSLIGLGLNELCLYIGIDLIYGNWLWLQGLISLGVCKTLVKLGATGVVMVYNFISRKIFLEKKD
ncbi:MAG: GtrA family protein [Eubacteriales bacterium]|nr:GtrA family protein [Eubacteriales bacterium]